LRKPGLELETLGSDTMLGICNLHYQVAKGHIYSTCTERKYAGNPLTDGENTIYNIHLTKLKAELLPMFIHRMKEMETKWPRHEPKPKLSDIPTTCVSQKTGM
jgi:hypothetical protein